MLKPLIYDPNTLKGGDLLCLQLSSSAQAAK